MTAIDRLTELHSAYSEAFGATQHPFLPLMASALATRDETLCAAVVAHVEAAAATTKEATALAAVARDLDADRSAPSLWLSADVAAVVPAPTQTMEQALRTDGSIRLAWHFRRERESMLGGTPLAARILFPGKSAAAAHVEAAGRVLGGAWRSWVMPSGDARAALLTAALHRTESTKR